MNPEDNPVGIEIYPAFFSTYIDQDEEEIFNLTIKNNKDVTLFITYQFGEFAQNPDSLSNYLTSLNKFDSWFSGEEVKIEPNTSTQIPITLSILSDQILDSATYYPTIILKFNTLDDSNIGTSINFEQAIPLYLAVQANEQARAKIQIFDSNRFTIGNDVEIFSQFENTGNTNLKIDAYLNISQKGIFGNQNKRLTPVSIEASNIYLLPGSQIERSTIWNQENPGKYEVTLNVEEQGNSLDSETISIWILPQYWWLIIIGIAIVLTAFGYFIAKMIKKLLSSIRKKHSQISQNPR